MRSDSDLSTFAYGFRPWTGAKAIADGPDILRYLRDAAADAGIDRHTRHVITVVRETGFVRDAGEGRSD